MSETDLQEQPSKLAPSAMRTFRIYGAPDDVVKVRVVDEAGRLVRSIDQAMSSDSTWTGLIYSPSDEETDGLSVLFYYDGCSYVGVGPGDAQVPMPSWPVSIQPCEGEDPDYSPMLVVHAPGDAELEGTEEDEDSEDSEDSGDDGDDADAGGQS